MAAAELKREALAGAIIRVGGIGAPGSVETSAAYKFADRYAGASCIAGPLPSVGAATVRAHGLFDAACAAYNAHRGLVLRPDDFRLAMLQGVARHVECEPEASRGLLEIKHAGQATIEVNVDARPSTSAEYAAENTRGWRAAMGAFRAQILERVGGTLLPTLMIKFSTTTEEDETAAAVALACAVQPYFKFEAYTKCGIPSITFEGTRADWALLRDMASALTQLRMDWWAAALGAVLDRILRDAFDAPLQGETRDPFWANVYNNEQHGGSGRPDTGDGWLFALLPYRSARERSVFNTDARSLGEGRLLAKRQALHHNLPRSIDSVDVLWRYLGNLPLPIKVAAGFGQPAVDAQGHVRTTTTWGVFDAATYSTRD